MKVETPQILWNSEVDDNKGRNAPLYAIDALESGGDGDGGHVLVSAGNTTDVNLWKTADGKISHMITLTRHERSVNAVAFSPDGLHLATAGEAGNVVIWSVPVQMRGNGNGRHYWTQVANESDLTVRIVGTHNCSSVCDLAWSADSKRFIAGGTTDRCVLVYEDENYAVNHPGESLVPKKDMSDDTKENLAGASPPAGAAELLHKESDWKPVFNYMGHSQFVQGVAYDPLNMYAASMSSDRTVRVYERKFATRKIRKLLTTERPAAVAKILTDAKVDFAKSKTIRQRKVTVVEPSNNTSDKEQSPEPTVIRQKLFCDESTCESFFRRLSWTTDGAFLIAPAALWHTPGSPPIFATYLFARHRHEEPYRVLPGLEKPSVVVKPNPVLFQLPKGVDPPTDKKSLPYRSVFCVLTLDSILVYDTHHTQPLALLQGLHYANLTDCAWSHDGHTLWVSSTDGYISIVRFAAGELGEVYVPPVEEDVSIPAASSDVEECTKEDDSSEPMDVDDPSPATPTDSASTSNCAKKDVDQTKEQATDANDTPATTEKAKKKRRIQPVLISID